ncbi:MULTISPECIES: endonuclease III domain-containing protein [Halomicrobium]|uniref:DNA-(Apurinic or apyrimidinic site) lyase n=2 Tax=Halomicrobium mukohataei TaxID=57705 RepID=C7P1U0_HALMD|nr:MULTISPECIES: endonuclease III [Halomicrobium]ACV49180.1 DNA-(apurinic or apyrimidinic site) lyase [Halomicrobium mukohataei DSM 12286]QCD64586.1 endonuclease III [Halomicrobium mukohataei]QFR19393.1 endonuclease III [Halomicrobium sp. ZPS1]
MSDDAEPSVNISGGESGGGAAVEFEPADAETRAEAVVDRLGELYWTKAYGGRDAFECLVRTILSQNTSDKASQPAHDALMERYGADGEDLAATLADADQQRLAETIQPAGLHNQKSETIVRLAGRVCEEYGFGAEFDAFVRGGDPGDVRSALLDMKGVGPKTADCVLLFAGGRGGVFPVDTHVHRIARRMGLAPADADHEGVRAALEDDIPAEKCGFGHTAMIQFGREYCSARKPACLDDPEACPLADQCEQLGVSPATGEVFDPAERAE